MRSNGSRARCGRTRLQAMPLSAIAFAAIFGFGEPEVVVRTIDAANGRAVPGSIVVGAERLEWHEFHSTRSVCARAAAARSDAHGEAHLRPAGSDPSGPLGSTHRSLVIAYREGYCAGTLNGTARLHSGEAPMAASADPAEPRLRYLALIARQAATACFEAGDAWLAPFQEAVLAEASRLASSPLEKLLAVRVEEAFDLSGRPRKTLRTVLHGSAIQGNVGGMEQMLLWAKADPFLAKGFCPPGQNTCMMPMPDPSRMPREVPFQIDERDEAGMSALMAAAKAMKPDAVRWLLDQGADVNVLTGPGGYNALDLVLSRARDDLQENAPEGLEGHLLRMIALLATGTARPTLHPRYREELADPAAWTVGPRLRKFWSDVRERVIGYEARAPLELACPIVEPARASLDLRGAGRR